MPTVPVLRSGVCACAGEFTCVCCVCEIRGKGERGWSETLARYEETGERGGGQGVVGMGAHVMKARRVDQGVDTSSGPSEDAQPAGSRV